MKLSETLVKVNDNVAVYRYDNGFMVEVGGQNKEEEWVTRKIVCNTLEEVLTLVTEYSKLPLN